MRPQTQILINAKQCEISESRLELQGKSHVYISSAPFTCTEDSTRNKIHTHSLHMQCICAIALWYQYIDYISAASHRSITAFLSKMNLTSCDTAVQ